MAAKRSGPSAAILLVGLELLAVGVFTLIAGASDDVGKVVLIIMVGLWIMYLITEASVIAQLEKALGNVIGQTSSGGGTSQTPTWPPMPATP